MPPPIDRHLQLTATIIEEELKIERHGVQLEVLW